MKTPVVYTMGKVASTSIFLAIKRAGLPCHDIHTLNDASLKSLAKQYLERGEFPPLHVCVSMAWKTREIIRKSQCIYISLVREPVARNISAFFHNRHLSIRGLEGSGRDNAREVFNHFMKNYPHSLPTKWFEKEFAKHLGIDVYSIEFDCDRKFAISHDNNVVLFRVDAPDRVKSSILSDVLGREISVGRDNDSDSKAYQSLYSRVREVARFTPEFLDGAYETRFARHFWTDEELRGFKAFWLGDRPEHSTARIA